MKFKFEKLRIWQEAMDYVEKLNVFATNFPKLEVYNLSMQLCRAGGIQAHQREGCIPKIHLIKTRNEDLSFFSHS